MRQRQETAPQKLAVLTSQNASMALRSYLRQTTAAPLLSRCFHSYQHPPPPSPYNPVETAILEASLARVPEHGFSTAAMVYGARDVGYLDISVNLFPRGAFDLIAYHLVSQRLRLVKAVEFEDTERQSGKKLGVGAKVRALCIERLRGNGPYIHHWQEVIKKSPFYP